MTQESENELARRRFINGHIEGFWTDLQSLRDRYVELRDEASMAGTDILEQVFAPHLAGDRVAGLVERFGSYVVGVIEALLVWGKTGKTPGIEESIDIVTRELKASGARVSRAVDIEQGDRLLWYQLPPEALEPMAAQLVRMFRDAPKLTNPDGTPDETQLPAVQCHVILRGQFQPMPGALSVTPEGGLKMLTPSTVDGKPKLVETYFDLRDITCLIVEREIRAERGSSIIMG